MERKTYGARRGRAETGSGWLATLAGAALLMAAGFGVGLVAGAAFEEPELVMDHLRGRTRSAPLQAPGPGQQAESPAEIEPGPDAQARQEPSPPVEASPPAEPLTAPPPTAPPDTGFSVQVGAFAERGAADSLVGELRQLGFAAGIFETEGRAPYKVRVGPVPTKGEAERLADVLKRKHRLPTWVVSLESR